MLPVFPAWRRATRALSLALALSAYFAISVSAQQAPTEYRTQSISVFGGFLYDNISFRPGSATGFTAGLDLTHYFRRYPLAASLEGRAGSASGTVANERSYTFGPRVEYGVRRVRPYAEFEVGIGTIHFGTALSNQLGYYADRSTIIAGGAGVDIDLFHNFAAQFDYQYQHWDTAPQTHQVFTPTVVSVGVHYTLPFRSFVRAGDPSYR